MFNNDELKSLAILLERVTLTGKEATTVAILLQKVKGLITPEETKDATESVGDSI